MLFIGNSRRASRRRGGSARRHRLEERARQRSRPAALRRGRVPPGSAGTLLAALTIYDRLSGTDVRTIPSSALAIIAGVSLARAQLEAMAETAHAASVELPADPADPLPADTSNISTSGGPC
jgi:hypothetical protein